MCTAIRRIPCCRHDDDFTDQFLGAVRTATPGQVVCYDRNFCGLGGVHRLCELLATIESPDLDVRVLLVAPNYIDADLCIERIMVRPVDHDGITAATADVFGKLGSFVTKCQAAARIVQRKEWQPHVLRTDFLWREPAELDLLVKVVEQRLAGAPTVGELGRLVAGHHDLALPEAPTGQNDGSRAAGRHGGSLTPESRSTHGAGAIQPTRCPQAQEGPKLPQPVTMTCVRCKANFLGRWTEPSDAQRHCFNCAPKRAKVTVGKVTVGNGEPEGRSSGHAQQGKLMHPTMFVSRCRQDSACVESGCAG